MHTSELDVKIVTELRRITRAIDWNSNKLLQEHGVTTPQLITLRELAQVAECRVGELATRVKLSQATMTGILDRLVQHGFIHRCRKEQDRRSVFVSITQAGINLVETAPSLLQDRFRNELGQLDAAQQAEILGVLQRIARMMGAEEWSAAPILVSGAEPLASPDAATSKNGAAVSRSPIVSDSGQLISGAISPLPS